MSLYWGIVVGMVLLASVLVILYVIFADDKLYQELDKYKSKDWRYDG